MENTRKRANDFVGSSGAFWEGFSNTWSWEREIERFFDSENWVNPVSANERVAPGLQTRFF